MASAGHEPNDDNNNEHHYASCGELQLRFHNIKVPRSVKTPRVHMRNGFCFGYLEAF
eukprot:COSAG02_NODE_61280_length_269_cov_0.605882_1_plen_56_part_01